MHCQNWRGGFHHLHGFQSVCIPREILNFYTAIPLRFEAPENRISQIASNNIIHKSYVNLIVIYINQTKKQIAIASQMHLNENKYNDKKWRRRVWTMVSSEKCVCYHRLAGAGVL